MFTFSNEILFLLTLIATAISTVLWINRQFSNLKDYVNRKMEKLEETILSKLEYHERHDDRRFSEISNDIWEIRVRNAAIDGVAIRNKIEKLEEASK